MRRTSRSTAVDALGGRMFRSAARSGWTPAGFAGCPAARSGTGWSGHGAEIFVDAPQQVDQDFPLVLFQAGQQAAFALKRGDDHLVMGYAALRGQRNRVAAAVVRGG